MSVSGSREMLTAIWSDLIEGDTETTAHASLEASEDRKIHGVKCVARVDNDGVAGAAGVEVSLSAQPKMIGPGAGLPVQDESQAGTLDYSNTNTGTSTGEVQQNGDDQVLFDPPVDWSEGEEINIHTRNTQDAADVGRGRAIIYYSRV